ncbi:hypothetical protein K1X76_12935 [bacterium]|nr:hypothetical protein [bacterium]
MRFTFLTLLACMSFIHCGGTSSDNDSKVDGSETEAANFVGMPKNYFNIEMAQTSPGIYRYVIVTDLTHPTIQNYLESGCLYVTETSTRIENGDYIDRSGSFAISNEEGEIFSDCQYFGNTNETAENIMDPVRGGIVAYMAALSFQENCEGSTQLIANDKVEP